jgi:predicted DNA-binding transcriptional regulator AlpA
MPAAGTKRRSRSQLVSMNDRHEMTSKMSSKQLLTLEDLASLLGRSPDTIKKDMRRNPEAVPPRLLLPHTRLLRWRLCDVDAWLGQLALTTPCKGVAQ